MTTDPLHYSQPGQGRALIISRRYSYAVSANSRKRIKGIKFNDSVVECLGGFSVVCPEEYFNELRRLYDARGIGIGEKSPPFACRHWTSCEAAAAKAKRNLRKGAEAHVGKNYGKPIRLVVVSLDIGGRGNRPNGEDLRERWDTIQKVTYETANRQDEGHGNDPPASIEKSAR